MGQNSRRSVVQGFSLHKFCDSFWLLIPFVSIHHIVMEWCVLRACLVIWIAWCNVWIGRSQTTFNVLQYGAKGDSHTDDSSAFLKAWEAFCGASEGAPTLMVPSGYSFLLSQTNFKGPCSSSKPHIQILGTLRAPHKDAWGGCSKMWLSISGVKGLTVDGSGTVDGQGQAWWADSQVLDRCGELPAGIQFFHCDGLQMSGLAHINGPGSHVKVDQSNDVTISHLTITSPKDSPNTDGIDVANAERVYIQNCIIRTGDDCIAIKGGSHFINITEIHCGPGHGISVGSLGRNGAEEHVEDIRVWKCNIEGGESAARIKTWPGGKGYARRISFEHITVSETREPILIDQHYDHRGEEKEAVRVSEVGFRDIRGTCVDERAIVLDCAMVGCRDIQVEGIEIRSMDPEKPASAICNHAYGSARDSSPPVSCLSRYLRPLLSLV